MNEAITLGLALGANFLASRHAAAQPTMRWQLGQSDSLYMDGRFLGGVAATAISMGTTGTVSQGAEALGLGLLGSLVAGEAYRAQAISEIQRVQAATAAATQGGAPFQPNINPQQPGIHGLPQYAPPMGPPAGLYGQQFDYAY